MLLSKWLEAVIVVNPQPPLTDAEVRLLDFVNEIMAETEEGTAPNVLVRPVYVSIQLLCEYGRNYFVPAVSGTLSTL